MAFRKKIRILLDADFVDKNIIIELKKTYNVAIANRRATDDEVVQDASKNNRHVISRNTKDFSAIFRKTAQMNIGMICISSSLTGDRCVSVLKWFLQNEIKEHKNLNNKLYKIDRDGYKGQNKGNNQFDPKKEWPPNL